MYVSGFTIFDSLLNVSSLPMTSQSLSFRTKLNVPGVRQNETVLSLVIDIYICDYRLGQDAFRFVWPPYSTLYSV